MSAPKAATNILRLTTSNIMKHIYLVPALFSALALTACTDDDNLDVHLPEAEYGTPNEWYYAGGKLGTTSIQSAYAYRQATQAVDDAGLSLNFQIGESLFEKDYNTSNDAFAGLGPVYVRRGCLYCHPNYGHGKRQTAYRADQDGNGYLLVVYDKKTDAYIYSVAGMPQTKAVKPFKPQIDESKINIKWKNYTDEWGNKFPDGETYSLIYPEVTIPADAYYSPVTVKRDGKYVVIPADQVASEIGVRLESTIGIYGTGLTDAIPDDSITAEWKRQSEYFNSVGKTNALNPAYWSQADNKWVSYYVNNAGDKKQYVRRYTYAMSRGPILDAAGANAIWNITNVTRPDRRYHYLSLDGTIYAKSSMEDPDVQAGFPEYIKQIDPNKTHPTWHTDDVKQNIYNYLMAKDLDAEMSSQQYKNFMIWHRGLAVPAARNTNTDRFKQGMKLFKEIGCANCHRPSWTTGDDNIQDPNGIFKNNDMPRYPHQKIWPYTDFVQHRLFMENDIRTGWCRTTPLWGRGLSKLCTGAEDRLHDCRARNTMEAIMWHGNAKSDARYAIEKFRNLKKADRDNIIFFIESI